MAQLKLVTQAGSKIAVSDLRVFQGNISMHVGFFMANVGVETFLRLSEISRYCRTVVPRFIVDLGGPLTTRVSPTNLSPFLSQNIW